MMLRGSTGARGEVPRSSELFERFRMVVAGALPSAAVLLCGRVFRYLPLLGGVAPRGRDGRAGSAGIVVAVVRRSESRLRSARATARASLRAAEELESLFMRIAVLSVLLPFCWTTRLYHAPEHGADSAPRSGRSVIHRGTVCLMISICKIFSISFFAFVSFTKGAHTTNLHPRHQASSNCRRNRHRERTRRQS